MSSLPCILTARSFSLSVSSSANSTCKGSISAGSVPSAAAVASDAAAAAAAGALAEAAALALALAGLTGSGEVLALHSRDTALLLLGDPVADRVERQPRDLLERLEDAEAMDGRRLENGGSAGIEQLRQLLDRQDVAQVALVELEDERDALRVDARAPRGSGAGWRATPRSARRPAAGCRPRTPRRRRPSAPVGASRCRRPGPARCRAGAAPACRRSRRRRAAAGRRTGCGRPRSRGSPSRRASAARSCCGSNADSSSSHTDPGRNRRSWPSSASRCS